MPQRLSRKTWRRRNSLEFYGDPLGGRLHAQKSDYNSYSTTTYNKHNSYNTNDKYKFDDNNIYNNS